MKKYLKGAIFLSGALILSGCSTDEVRKDTSKPGEDLTFKLEEPQAPPAQKIPPPPAPTPVPNNVTNTKMYQEAPLLTIDSKKAYTATLRTTAGDIVLTLTADKTPETVNNFVFLAREKFYDNTIFHRTIKGFMIQGGDPEGTGRGGPGYQFDDEPFEGTYARGTLAMANAGPNTNGSQFFIMHQDGALPPNYVIFGKVLSGLEVVDKIATAPTKPEGEGSTPVNPVKVTSIEIEEK